jgi:hypothetical protein
LKSEQILRGTPVKLFGAGEFRLAENVLRQQVRSFAAKMSGRDKMINMTLEILKRDLNITTSSSVFHHYLQADSQFSGQRS